MATIADFTARLDHQTRALALTTSEDGLKAHTAGWMLLAKHTSRALSYLPLGGRPEQVGLGPAVVLKPLIDGPRRRLPANTEPVPALAQLAVTVGAIGDILADNLRINPRPEDVGREAAKLQASLLATVHVAARWSRACLEGEYIPHNRLSIRGFLDDLAAVTEPYALIPPANRGGALQDLRIRTDTAPGLTGAATAWADESILVLTERYRTSGWAMQAIAANLALISQTAHTAVQQAARRGELPDLGRAATQPLATSVTAWRAAAAWPPYLRLGGKAMELRALTRDLHHHLLTNPPATVADTRALLRVAAPVAEAHTATMDRLVLGHELWIHGPSLGSSAGYIPGWAREPWWSHQGLVLMKTAQIGQQALAKSNLALATTPDLATEKSLPLGWPPACQPPANLRAEDHHRGRDVTISRGPAR